MRHTWYILEDGSAADPREVAPDDKGVLRHKGGMAVAIGSHGNPRSRGVDVDENGRMVGVQQKVPAKAPEKPPAAKDRQVSAAKEGDPNYKTR